jgi:hypothetical protein
MSGPLDCHRAVIFEQTSKWALSSKPPAKCWRLICNTGEESFGTQSYSIVNPCRS